LFQYASHSLIKESKAMPEIRVVIADDHAVLREGLKSILTSSGDISVVGEARDGQEAIDLAQSLSPDLILMDIAMSGLGGLEATTRIRKEFPAVKVLVLTQYNDKEYIIRFLRAGAGGYVLKSAPGRDVVAAIRTVHGGGLYLNTPNAPALIMEALSKEEKTLKGSYESLSDREKEVLKLIIEGMTSRQIADALTVSIKTVVTHRANLMEKLGIHNKADLIKFGLRHAVASSNPMKPSPSSELP